LAVSARAFLLVLFPRLRAHSFQPTILTRLRYAGSSRRAHLISTRTPTRIYSARPPTKTFRRPRQCSLLSISSWLTTVQFAPSWSAVLPEPTMCIIPLPSHSVFSTDNAQLSCTPHWLPLATDPKTTCLSSSRALALVHLALFSLFCASSPFLSASPFISNVPFSLGFYLFPFFVQLPNSSAATRFCTVARASSVYGMFNCIL